MIEHPRYEALSVLGEGAQGLVVRVTDREAPQRALVAKVWKADAFPAGLLEAEFALLARRRVRGLVRAHDLGRDKRSGAPFLVEDFVAGEDLTEHLTGAARSPEDAARRLASVLRDVAATLASLHAAGFVHGDIKPTHVRIPRDAQGDPLGAVLIDLGAALEERAARSADRGAIAMTRAWAAPEVLAGATPSGASDLYSLGASAWSAVTGMPPDPRRTQRLRDVAPWVPPSLADLVDTLLAPHPADRFEGAEALLAAVSKVGISLQLRAPAETAYPTLFGRDAELAELLRTDSTPRVRWLTGPSGSGKSHLLREAMTRALLSGRAARLVSLPTDDLASVMRLVRFLRGEDVPLPFAVNPPEQLLLLLDGVDDGPKDLASALDAFACRIHSTDETLSVVAATRHERSAALALGPLPPPGFRALASSLGLTRDADVDALERASERWPGWAVAAHAGMPIEREAVLARARTLTPAAMDLLGAISLFGGVMPRRACVEIAGGEGALADLVSAGLASRRGDADVALTSPALADAIAGALGTQAVVDACARLLEADEEPNVTALLRVATAARAPANRSALLALAAARARDLGLVAEETDALLELCAHEADRTAARLTRVERLTRDSGRKQAHLRVNEWLWDLARTDGAVRSLALRRRAEKLARDGDYAGAFRDVDDAIAHAEKTDDVASRGYGLATRGAVHLYAGSGDAAARALTEARAVLDGVATPDAEELARLDHNLGAALLYGNEPARAAEALTRSLSTKRRLSDLGGVRSCLMNLGIARSKARDWEAADQAFQEATDLAALLGQETGLAWCHVERAELALRRGRTDDAARFAAEALARRSALPTGVMADLSLVRAEIALARGRADLAESELSRIAPETRAEDAVVDARAWLCTSRIALASLPVRARSAARAAARAMRRARTARNDELFEKARETLLRIRTRETSSTAQSTSTDPTTTTRADAMDDTLWELLSRLTSSEPGAAPPMLLTELARSTGAERVFLLRVSPDGTAQEVWGMDADGLPLEQAGKRVPPSVARAAREADGFVHERDVENGVGRGARLAIAKAGAVLVLEHRFVPGRFDSLSLAVLQRWLALANVALVVARGSDATAPARAEQTSRGRSERHEALPEAESTVNPRRAARREFPEIRGSSAALERALGRLDTAIDSELPALITGETGVGKELFSRALHELGPRARAAFVAVNCAAIPDTLFEAELFGHAKGAFTGADRARPGLLAKAEGGTLLLDEVGELSPARQASLLRVLESRRYRPVGSDEERAFDVRIVAATNKDLADAVARGTFRGDLLYRLRVLDIRVPPLREREGDVPLLARHFLGVAKSKTELSARALEALSAYAWPGNVRQLAHQMQRIAALSIPVCDVAHLSREIRAATPATRAQRAEREAENEQAEVLRAMELAGGNITHAAARLGLTRHGLKKKMLRLGLRAKLGVQRSG